MVLPLSRRVPCFSFGDFLKPGTLHLGPTLQLKQLSSRWQNFSLSLTLQLAIAGSNPSNENNPAKIKQERTGSIFFLPENNFCRNRHSSEFFWQCFRFRCFSSKFFRFLISFLNNSSSFSFSQKTNFSVSLFFHPYVVGRFSFLSSRILTHACTLTLTITLTLTLLSTITPTHTHTHTNTHTLSLGHTNADTRSRFVYHTISRTHTHF